MNLSRYPLRKETTVSQAEIELLIQKRDENLIINKNGNSAVALASILREGKEEIILFANGWSDPIFTNNSTMQELKNFIERHKTRLIILFAGEPKGKIPIFLLDYVCFRNNKLEIIEVSLNIATKFFDIQGERPMSFSQYPVIVDKCMCHIRLYPNKFTFGEIYSCTAVGEKEKKVVESNLLRIQALIDLKKGKLVPLAPQVSVTEKI
ncbi:MAG: hypothetical protein RL641_504 [Candidatus Parcubacteria bacterium]